jgi:hypothetical protein
MRQRLSEGFAGSGSPGEALADRLDGVALRWVAVAFDAISKGFRRIMGYKHLWMLKAALDEPSRDQSLVDQAKAG